MTLRDHLSAVERQTGRPPERLLVEPIPQEYIWHFNTWIELSAGRTQTGYGPSPFTWLDIHAYSSVTGVRFNRRDLTLLRIIDAAYFTAQAEEKERQDKAKPKN